MKQEELDNMRLMMRLNRLQVPIKAYRPYDLDKMLSEYGKVEIYSEIVYVEKWHIPLEYSGSCDSMPHVVTISFKGPDEELISIRTESVKSTNHNCLINCFS